MSSEIESCVDQIIADLKTETDMCSWDESIIAEVRQIITKHISQSIADEKEKRRAIESLYEGILKRIGKQAEVMLNSAQTLRIQQVQATAEWSADYKEKADAAWASINAAHKQIHDICTDAPEGEKQ